MEKKLEMKNIPWGYELCFNANCQHRPVPRHLGTDGRVQEVYCVIAHPDHKVEHCKYNQEYNYSEK